MKRRTFTQGMCGCLLSGGLSACVTHRTGPVVSGDATPGYQPDLATDEAGLWMVSADEEKRVKGSKMRIRDEAVNALVEDVICNLAGRYCPDLRSYVLRMPIFNASCYANGMVQVFTGLLLRVRNEGQLAAVLGHEFGHFLRKHSLQRVRDTRNKKDAAAVIAIAMGAAGAPRDLFDAGTQLLNLSLSSFSRDNEREADELGLVLMADAGYHPSEAAAVWERLIEEEKASEEAEARFNVFTAGHPSADERVENLTKAARAHPRTGPARPNRLLEALRPIRSILLEDEINLGFFKKSEKIFDRLIAEGQDSGEVYYYKGELYRRRGKHNDEVMALGFYHQSCELPGAPPSAFRQVGLMRWRREEKEVAREYFRRYLHVAPEAPDRAMITKFLEGA